MTKNRTKVPFCCIVDDEVELIFVVDEIVLDSERSEECVDFTMIITIRNNAPISNYGGGFRCKNEYPWCIIEENFPTVFKKIEKNKKKNDGKTGIFTQNQFSTKSIFFYGCNSKTNHCKYLKLSPNVYISVIYILLNFHKILTFFDVDKKFLDDQKVLKI
ncbi:Uncharacterized protein FWK35_00032890 [Aphis craccivora]|uniref:Uncharacterized protein n=1 Tax=Aphis craccivora TaxID=307492 RepID=A0A6G0Y4J7_APHCR|nr:Uncharacterized protein FWK35_00032890 [Aphis craccivora]